MTCPFTNSAFGSPTRPVFGLRLENTQNLVSINVPEVIESRRASCTGIGISMVGVAVSVVLELVKASNEMCVQAGVALARGLRVEAT